MFGVLTHADEIDESDETFRNLERRFRQSLGIDRRRYLLCSSYCETIPHENNRNPNIEVPMINFLTEVRYFYITVYYKRKTREMY